MAGSEVIIAEFIRNFMRKENDKYVFLQDKFNREHDSFFDIYFRAIDGAEKYQAAKEVLEWADRTMDIPLGAFVDINVYYRAHRLYEW
jgi:hypothetical protein